MRAARRAGVQAFITKVRPPEFLLKVDDVLGAFYLVEAEGHFAFYQFGALGTLFAHFFLDGERKALGCYTAQGSLQLFALSGEHLDTLALVNFVLAQHLEGLSYAGAAHFELKVLLLAVEMALDVAAEFYAVFNLHALFVVYLYHDAVVGTDGEVGQEVVLTLQPLFHQTFYKTFVNHSLCFQMYFNTCKVANIPPCPLAFGYAL